MEKKKVSKKKPESYKFKAVYQDASDFDDMDRRIMMLETIVIGQDERINELENELIKKNKPWWRLIIGR